MKTTKPTTPPKAPPPSQRDKDRAALVKKNEQLHQEALRKTGADPKLQDRGD